MKRTGLLPLSVAIVLAGGAEASRPQQLGATNVDRFFCTVCVPPPIFCIDHHEWDGFCEPCGLASEAVQCPASGPECPPFDAVLFCTD